MFSHSAKKRKHITHRISRVWYTDAIMRRIEFLLIFAAVAILVGIFYVAQQQKPAGSPLPHMTVRETTGVFPPSIPVESDAKMTSDYEVTLSDGRARATHMFESAVEPSGQVSFYQNFFSDTKNGWVITGQSHNGDQDAIVAENPSGTLTVNIAKNPLTGHTVIDMGFLTRITRRKR